ncbi:ABC transporter permease [Brevibacillus dissolubilis]|uniref:ABC transporter permease n=1 Tax=Brevibacillus dissolubilis TaxID=1844116 RepID=UPI00111689FF|nr:ABC transporter permease subunit [Brevibacillus dissolubilis]
MTALPMIKKEFRELFTSYKILFIPLVFIALTITQPITMKMLPTLLENATGLPEGTVIEIPTPTAAEVLATAVSKFSTLGSFILIMIVMGSIAGERASGVASMVFVKPISRAKYYLAKAFTYYILTIVSMLIAMGVTAYYTEILFGDLSWLHVWTGTLMYIPNLLLVVTTTLCASSYFSSAVSAGGVSLVFNIVIFTVPPFLGTFLSMVSPDALTNASMAVLRGSALTEASVTAAPSLAGVFSLIAIFFFMGWYLLEKQEI